MTFNDPFEYNASNKAIKLKNFSWKAAPGIILLISRKHNFCFLKFSEFSLKKMHILDPHEKLIPIGRT